MTSNPSMTNDSRFSPSGKCDGYCVHGFAFGDEAHDCALADAARRCSTCGSTTHSRHLRIDRDGDGIYRTGKVTS